MSDDDIVYVKFKFAGSTQFVWPKSNNKINPRSPSLKKLNKIDGLGLKIFEEPLIFLNWKEKKIKEKNTIFIDFSFQGPGIFDLKKEKVNSQKILEKAKKIYEEYIVKVSGNVFIISKGYSRGGVIANAFARFVEKNRPGSFVKKISYDPVPGGHFKSEDKNTNSYLISTIRAIVGRGKINSLNEEDELVKVESNNSVVVYSLYSNFKYKSFVPQTIIGAKVLILSQDSHARIHSGIYKYKIFRYIKSGFELTEIKLINVQNGIYILLNPKNIDKSTLEFIRPIEKEKRIEFQAFLKHLNLYKKEITESTRILVEVTKEIANLYIRQKCKSHKRRKAITETLEKMGN